MSRRIIYVTEIFPFPTGGPRIVYRHVEMLRRNGFDAVVFDKGKLNKMFFETDPSITVRSIKLNPSDILVYPEPWANDMLLAKSFPNKKVVFCQNHFYVSYGLKGASDYEAAYGISTVFCCGDFIAQYLRDVIKIENVPIVHNGIDRTVFRSQNKKLQIAYMPRKMARPAEFICDTFRRLHPQYAHVPWVKIENVTEREVAKVLGESTIFLSLAFLEGVGLPPIEAMSSETLVVGFDGDGGKEYANKDNGRWHAEGDYLSCIESIKTLLDDTLSNRTASQKQLDAGKLTAKSYSLERMESELIEFWNKEIKKA